MGKKAQKKDARRAAQVAADERRSKFEQSVLSVRDDLAEVKTRVTAFEEKTRRLDPAQFPFAALVNEVADLKARITSIEARAALDESAKVSYGETLVDHAERSGLPDIVARAIAGEFDSTPEEADEWARSADGRAAFANLLPTPKGTADE